MRKLNKKGYMLVEIILASALAFGIAYFILDLTIGMKNKNDDLLVETIINTDRVIITNKLMDYAITETEDFDCSKLTISDKMVLYKEESIDIVNNYADIGELSCKNEFGKITINIPLDVKQMPESDFDINLDYKYKIGDMIPPTCSLSINGNTVKAIYEDNEGGSGIAYYGWDSSYTGENNHDKEISTGTLTYYVKDNAGNINNCSIEVIATNSYKCNCGICDGTYDCNCRSNCDYLPESVECWTVCDRCGSYYECNCSTCYSCPSLYNKASNSYCYK